MAQQQKKHSTGNYVRNTTQPKNKNHEKNNIIMYLKWNDIKDT